MNAFLSVKGGRGRRGRGKIHAREGEAAIEALGPNTPEVERTVARVEQGTDTVGWC